VSIFITPVPALDAASAENPAAGSSSTGNSGELNEFVITDPTEGPIEISGSGDGSLIAVSSGVNNANVILDGELADEIVITDAVDAAGNSLDGSGTAFQVSEDFEGSVIANLEFASTSGASVDLSTATESGTIADALGGEDSVLAGDFAYYINGGAGTDQLGGSAGADFIRGGAGDDRINAGAGDDLVRVGSGSDSVTLGAGADTVYWTVDQFEGDSVNIITDFTTGVDKIAIDADLLDRIEVDFAEDGQSFTVTLSGDTTGSTTVISEKDAFDDIDFEFV